MYISFNLIIWQIIRSKMTMSGVRTLSADAQYGAALYFNKWPRDIFLGIVKNISLLEIKKIKINIEVIQ